MSATHPSRRFNPGALTEKLVPALLIILVVALLAVFVIIVLSLTGIIPSA